MLIWATSLSLQWFIANFKMQGRNTVSNVKIFSEDLSMIFAKVFSSLETGPTGTNWGFHEEKLYVHVLHMDMHIINAFQLG